MRLSDAPFRVRACWPQSAGLRGSSGRSWLFLPNAQKGKISRSLLNMQALFLHWFIFSRAPGSNTAASRARERSVALINGRCAAPCAPVLSGGIIANAVTHQSENDRMICCCERRVGFEGVFTRARSLPWKWRATIWRRSSSTTSCS
jgi:hypothetical protein